MSFRVVILTIHQLPFRPVADPSEADIVDETLDLFRANSLFRNFEIKGPADRLLIILILFVSDCLAKIGTAKTVPSQLEATKTLNTLAVDNFPIPGDANFALNAHYAPPGNRADAGEYMSIIRCCGSSYICIRVPPGIPYASPPRARVSVDREAVRGWDRQT